MDRLQKTNGEAVGQSTIHYWIKNSYPFTIEGQTNVHSFSCKLINQFTKQSVHLNADIFDPRFYYTKNTILKLNIQDLDCGNNIMNIDLRKTLNASNYPYIEIKLLKIKKTNFSALFKSGKPLKVFTLVNIYLNGHSNQYWVDILLNKKCNKKFLLSGEKSLRLSDFMIKPPEVYMGLIKVTNKIKITFDLEIELE